MNILDFTPGNSNKLINNYVFTIERECIKIGVIYISAEQRTQNEILRNKCGSYDYSRFLSLLGEKISLEKHLGYMAGLKANLDGKSAIYYSDSSLEIMFHVSTMMPSCDDDEQQITKKRFQLFVCFPKFFI